MKLSLRAFFQAEYKKLFTNKLFIFGSEALGSCEIFEENDEKNGVNDAEKEEVNILGK
jgi:hypothetical protein